MINFDSDKIIILLFQPGSCGNLLSFLLSLSKEVATAVDYDMSKIAFTHSHSHHYNDSWVRKIDGVRHHFPYLRIANLIEYRDYISIYSTERFRKTLEENQKRIILTAHSHNHATIYFDIFPNANIIVIDSLSYYYFTYRAYYEKVHMIQNKENTKNKIYDTLKYDNNVLYDAIEIFKARQINHYIIDLKHFLGINNNCYFEVCSYLNISPSPLFNQIKNIYFDAQWKRKPNDKK